MRPVNASTSTTTTTTTTHPALSYAFYSPKLGRQCCVELINLHTTQVQTSPAAAATEATDDTIVADRLSHAATNLARTIMCISLSSISKRRVAPLHPYL